MVSKIKGIHLKFSKYFWLLMVSAFIDFLGGSLIFPFFSLFMTKKFEIGMTQVGTMFLVWALASGLIGNTLGGALADKFGRKANIIFGLIASASSALFSVLIDDLTLFYVVIGFIGIFEDIAGPARQAMIADMVPDDLRGEAYGINRIVMNLAATIAPIIGGYMATRSFEMLFYADVAISLIAAAFVLFLLPETKPEQSDSEKEEESFKETLQGYKKVLRDKVFIGFVGVSILSVLMYFNMNSTLSVYLVEYKGITPSQFGTILSMNAGMVVVLQVLFTRITKKWKPLLTLALGDILYVIGFTMYGIFNSYGMFILAMVIITTGEMVFSPKEQTIIANYTPENMRGRYMAIASFAWIIPIAIGPLVGGFIMDHYDPRLLWYLVGLVGLLAAVGFVRMHRRNGNIFNALDRIAADPEKEAQCIEPLSEVIPVEM